MNVRVLGLGNVLMSDDGFGPYAVRVLEAFYDMPDEVQVIDAGTPGLDLTPFLLDADVVILLDTIKAPGRAGEIHVFQLEDILRHPPQPRLSPHDPGIKEALLTVAAAGSGPTEVVLIGVVPEWVATGVALSPPVRAAIVPALGLAVTELDRLGVRPRMRPVPRQPDTWWEKERSAVGSLQSAVTVGT